MRIDYYLTRFSGGVGKYFLGNKHAGKFASPDHEDFKEIANFLGLMDEEESEIWTCFMYEKTYCTKIKKILKKPNFN